MEASNYTGGFAGWNPSTSTVQQKPVDTSIASAQPAVQQKSGMTALNPSGSSAVQVLDKPNPQQQASQNPPPPVVNPNSAFQTNTGNAPQGTPVQNASQTPTYSGLLGQVSGLANPSAATNFGLSTAQSGVQQYQKAISDLNQLRQNEATSRMNLIQSPMEIGDATGIQGAQSAAYGQRESALAQEAQGASQLFSPGINAAVSGTGQQITAGSNAINSIPEALRYGGASGGLDPQSQSNTLAKDVISGKMTYQDALNAMSIYGNAGNIFLQQAIRSQSPDFNFSQAQSLAPTQGSVGPNLQSAQNSINILQQTIQAMPNWLETGIPALNTIANLVSNIGIGTGSTAGKLQAIRETRTQVANALGTMTNTTPTAWDSLTETWFPDNATPDQIGAGVDSFSQFAKSRQQVYGSPGQTQFNSSGGSTGGNTNVQTSVGTINTNW